MIDPTDLVGTVMKVGDSEDVGLTEFLGEGATAVVYAYGAAESGAPSGNVVKIYKPRPWLEMETLHHSFRVHERLFPEHPLRMSPEDRLRRLTAEMMARIDSGRPHTNLLGSFPQNLNPGIHIAGVLPRIVAEPHFRP
jgi:hypothetical protein